MPIWYTPAMKNSLRTFLVLTLAATCALAFAQNVTGAWKGKIKMDMSKMPAPKDEQGKKMMAQVKDMMAKITINLTLNANKTYTIKATGIPGKEASQTSEGTWSQSGKSITVTPTKENGKKATGENAKKQTLTISADGKTISMMVPGAGQMGGSIIFTR